MYHGHVSRKNELIEGPQPQSSGGDWDVQQSDKLQQQMEQVHQRRRVPGLPQTTVWELECQLDSLLQQKAALQLRRQEWLLQQYELE